MIRLEEGKDTGKGASEWWGSRNFKLCGQGREGVPKKVQSGQITEGSKYANHRNLWAKSSSVMQQQVHRPRHMDMPGGFLE